VSDYSRTGRYIGEWFHSYDETQVLDSVIESAEDCLTELRGEGVLVTDTRDGATVEAFAKASAESQGWTWDTMDGPQQDSYVVSVRMLFDELTKDT
jgi:hypothetical protein